jgi:c-di-GMP-binding flagellar brake protein YcgR
VSLLLNFRKGVLRHPATDNTSNIKPQEQWTPMDKRKHERIDSLNLSYVCVDENENIVKQGMGRTLNVSESGILLETHFPIEMNHKVLLTIGLEEDLLDIKGKPVHIKSDGKGTYTVGIEFAECDAVSSQLLQNFIKSFNKQDRNRSS